MWWKYFLSQSPSAAKSICSKFWQINSLDSRSAVLRYRKPSILDASLANLVHNSLIIFFGNAQALVEKPWIPIFHCFFSIRRKLFPLTIKVSAPEVFVSISYFLIVRILLLCFDSLSKAFIFQSFLKFS